MLNENMLKTAPARIIVTAKQLNQRVQELALQISTDYLGKTLDVICLVNSASMFCMDLVRNLTIHTRLHFLGFTSYSQANESGEIRITLDINEPLYGRDLLIMEGIVVSGRTPRFLIDSINHRQPASIAMCALGVKNEQLTTNLPLKYIGFELGNEIVVGYGIGSPDEKIMPILFEK